MAERYDPKVSEPKWGKFWEDKGVYTFDEEGRKPIFSIDTPPPTMSGRMHVGHSFSYSQTDFIARYKRMKGCNVFYPFGTDDNGLATERMVEKLKNVRSKKMSREEFVALVLKTLDELRPEFVGDWKRLGISCDWSIMYSTIDKDSQQISQKSFVDLYKMGREYRKKAPVIFCPECKTALAQVEMKDAQRVTTLNYIKAKMESGEYVIYATTRPELHPACVGISLDKNGVYIKADVDGEKWIISKDSVEKFSKDHTIKILSEFKGEALIGKKVDIPLARKVPFSHDNAAKTDYGSGIVFYCTYGGLDCVQWMAQHQGVEPIHIMDESGVYTVGPYKGLRTPDARKAVIEDLKKMGVLFKQEHLDHIVNVHERCDTDIEYIATTQWFVKYLDLKEKFLDAGAQLNWYPSFMKTRLDNWIKGLQWDWCLSRQRYYGIPFPVWYCKKCGEISVADIADLPVDPLKDSPKKNCSKCKGKDFEPERDVFDTWATSSLTPALAIEKYQNKPIYNQLFPMSLRPQAHDIIAFWLFNTMVKSQLHHQKNPWKDAVISGWVLDPQGEKMSKSKGNILSPQVMMEKYSADALRFFAASIKLGEDVRFQEKELVAGQKTITKLWNAANFCALHFPKTPMRPAHIEKVDAWLLSKLQRIVVECTQTFDKYEYSRTKQEAEKFFWGVFCDYYVEIVKDRLYNPDKRGEQAKDSAQYTLYVSFLTILKLFAPIMPHITEELYQMCYKSHEGSVSIHVSSWPQVDKKMISEQDEKIGEVVVYAVSQARRAKTEQNKSLKAPVRQLVVCAKISQEEFSLIEADIKGATGAEKLLYKPLKEDSKIDVESEIEL